MKAGNAGRSIRHRPVEVHTSDAQLIRAARNDPDAFAELYRRHLRTIHAYLCARTPERAAGELTAETFAQAALSH